MNQFVGLTLEAAGSSGHFFHQSRVLLGGLVDVPDRFAHLRYAGRLFVAGRADFTHDIGHALDAGDHFGHGRAGAVHQCGTVFDPFHAGVDQALDFLGGFGGTPGQAAHFTGYHGKATPLLTSASRFHGGVQGQDVGLKRDAVDHADDVGNLA